MQNIVVMWKHDVDPHVHHGNSLAFCFKLHQVDQLAHAMRENSIVYSPADSVLANCKDHIMTSTASKSSKGVSSHQLSQATPASHSPAISTLEYFLIFQKGQQVTKNPSL